MITREQMVEQSVQNFIREELTGAGYGSGLLDIRDAFPTLEERATPMTKNHLAIGFNFDDGGRKWELGSPLTRRVYTIEFWVFGKTPEAGRNIAGVIRAVIEDASWLVPLVDLETDEEIDKLVVLDDRGITIQRQVTQQPRPWDHYVWTTTVKFEDFYLPGSSN